MKLEAKTRLAAKLDGKTVQVVHNTKVYPKRTS